MGSNTCCLATFFWSRVLTNHKHNPKRREREGGWKGETKEEGDDEGREKRGKEIQPE